MVQWSSGLGYTYSLPCTYTLMYSTLIVYSVLTVYSVITITVDLQFAVYLEFAVYLVLTVYLQFAKYLVLTVYLQFAVHLVLTVYLQLAVYLVLTVYLQCTIYSLWAPIITGNGVPRDGTVWDNLPQLRPSTRGPGPTDSRTDTDQRPMLTEVGPEQIQSRESCSGKKFNLGGKSVLMSQRIEIRKKGKILVADA